jgi:AraC-like DNA-binding protein
VNDHHEPARGILREDSPPPFTHVRLAPDTRVADLVEFFWSVRWELPDAQTFSQRVLSHPSVHIVCEPGRIYVAGIPGACFVRTLKGRGDVFSAKLLPGQVSRLLPGLAKDYTDQERALEDVLNPQRVSALLASVQGTFDLTERAEQLTRFLHELASPQDSEHLSAGHITRWIAAHPDALRIQDVCVAFDMHERTLQRLFARHVGVSPKWVIGRYRMHEAAMRLEGGQQDSLTELAHALGYFDQAHFTRDFKCLTGETPSYYRSRSGEASASSS